MPIITSEAAIKCLRDGDVVAIPTETVYGLAANATNDKAVAKIYSLKSRPQFNPLIIHVDSIEMVEEWAVVSKFAKELMNVFWYENPGPISFVLQLKRTHPLSLLALAGLDTVAVRRPNHSIALNILKQVKFPLAAPSANRSNSLSVTTVDHVLRSLSDEVSVVDGGACIIGLESTILDVTKDQIKVLRLGGVTDLDLRVFGKVEYVGHEHAINAPGMMRRHYAPQRLLKMNVVKREADMALLGFGACDDADLNLSESGDLSEAAANLFHYLHELDREPFTSIGVRTIPNIGVGMAINDRLTRACASE